MFKILFSTIIIKLTGTHLLVISFPKKFYQKNAVKKYYNIFTIILASRYKKTFYYISEYRSIQ